MNENERDTQFQGFAKLLLQELFGPGYKACEGNAGTAEGLRELEQIIAQRAYDLMDHIMLYAPVSPVPDLTEWPTL